MTKRIYNLALSIYSSIRHREYFTAKHLIEELLELVNAELLKEEKENVTKTNS